MDAGNTHFAIYYANIPPGKVNAFRQLRGITDIASFYSKNSHNATVANFF